MVVFHKQVTDFLTLTKLCIDRPRSTGKNFQKDLEIHLKIMQTKYLANDIYFCVDINYEG